MNIYSPKEQQKTTSLTISALTTIRTITLTTLDWKGWEIRQGKGRVQKKKKNRGIFH